MYQLCLEVENKYRPKHVKRKVPPCLHDNLPEALSSECWNMFFENFFIIFLQRTGQCGLLLCINS